MSSTAGPLDKKESPTEFRRTFNTKRVGKSDDFGARKLVFWVGAVSIYFYFSSFYMLI